MTKNGPSVLTVLRFDVGSVDAPPACGGAISSSSIRRPQDCWQCQGEAATGEVATFLFLLVLQVVLLLEGLDHVALYRVNVVPAMIE